MNYYIADLHFGHTNVLEFDNRPFENIEEHDKVLIENWNSRVTKNDHIYIIGDFAYRNKKTEDWYLERLNGRKHLIIGNHDKKLLKNEAAMKHFESVDQILHVTDGNHQICVCHYPIAEWFGYYKGHHHIYGHIHNKKSEVSKFMLSQERAFNAGCMLYGYVPVTFEELRAYHQNTLNGEEC